MMATEKRLIDPTEYASFLKRYIKELHEVDAPMIAGAVERCLYKLEAQPTADAVEVVRCGECRFVDTDDCTMSGTPGRVSASDFYSYGERRVNA